MGPKVAKHYVRRRQKDARQSLANAIRAGGVSLVLGAGVSLSRGVPSWFGLVKTLWGKLQPPHLPPDWLEGNEAIPHPLALQIVMEEIEGAIKYELAKQQNIKAECVDPIQVHDMLVQRISAELYNQPEKQLSNDTLGVLVELLRRDQKSERRVIQQVITFNADDLLERNANRDVDAGKEPVLFPVPRASFHPRFGMCANGKPPIAVFHLHGFVPRSPLYPRGAPDTLVLTDAQYWASVANPSSFANRVMGSALQNTRCIFIGLSMTDVNMMRWLGIRHHEFMADRFSYYEHINVGKASAKYKAERAMNRHYWICTEKDDPTLLITSHLERRGVTTVRLPAWGQPFSELMTKCFGAAYESESL